MTDLEVVPRRVVVQDDGHGGEVRESAGRRTLTLPEEGRHLLDVVELPDSAPDSVTDRGHSARDSDRDASRLRESGKAT